MQYKSCMSISFVLSYPFLLFVCTIPLRACLLRPSWVWTWTLWPCPFRCTYACVLPTPLNSVSLPTTITNYY
jgi:hypothetical protein